MSGSCSQQQQPPQSSHSQLRRAVYVHVSDLTSAYNIDHAKLEEELKRVKANRENALEPKARVGSSTETDSSSGTQKRLQPPRAGYNLCLLVGSVQIVVDKFRVDGSRVRVAEVEVGDETGTVSLRARDDQIDMLAEVSGRRGAVVLRNATLELYQGRHIRLAVTKWGKLTPYPDRVASTPAPPSRMNDDRYFSFIDLSAVASEMSVFTPSDYQAVRSSDYETTTTTNNQRNRSGPGNRRTGSSRGKTAVLTSIKQQPYQDNSRMLRNPSSLHSYAYAADMDSQSHAQPQGIYAYHPTRERQPDLLMLHQGYEMQQGHQQMHTQMHYQPPSLDRTTPALAGQGTAPILMSMSAPSFDGHFVSAADLAHQPPREFAVVRSPYGTLSGGEPRVDSPRMNPQAPTFDPFNRQTRRK